MGHEVAVSTMQLATAFAAIANGGYLVKPFLVEQIVRQDNKIEKNIKTRFKRKIASQKIMDEVKKMLRQVVADGTGIEANIAGWEIAGKTGTAQKYINGKYSDSAFISNFVGFFPLDEPQILGAIILDEPDAPMHWGGQGAAVAFKKIINRIINMDDKIKPPEKNQDTFFTNQYKAQMVTKTNTNHFPISLSTKASAGTIKVPNLKGKSLKKAIDIINLIGLKIKIEGSGQVVSQKPRPGTILRPKDICLVKLQ